MGVTAGVTMGEGMTDVENRFSHWSQNVSWMRHFGLNFEVNQLSRLKVPMLLYCFRRRVQHQDRTVIYCFHFDLNKHCRGT